MESQITDLQNKVRDWGTAMNDFVTKDELKKMETTILDGIKELINISNSSNRSSGSNSSNKRKRNRKERNDTVSEDGYETLNSQDLPSYPDSQSETDAESDFGSERASKKKRRRRTKKSEMTKEESEFKSMIYNIWRILQDEEIKNLYERRKNDESEEDLSEEREAEILEEVTMDFENRLYNQYKPSHPLISNAFEGAKNEVNGLSEAKSKNLLKECWSQKRDAWKKKRRLGEKVYKEKSKRKQRKIAKAKRRKNAFQMNKLEEEENIKVFYPDYMSSEESEDECFRPLPFPERSLFLQNLFKKLDEIDQKKKKDKKRRTIERKERKEEVEGYERKLPSNAPRFAKSCFEEDEQTHFPVFSFMN